MKLTKKLLPLLAIVPTVATLSTNLTACSKNKNKQSWSEAKKIALADYDEACFAAVKTANTQVQDVVEKIREDLIKFIKKAKNEDIINLTTKVALDIANIAINHSDKIATVANEWWDVKDFCNYLIDFEDGDERIKIALTIFDDVYQKALNSIDFLPNIKNLGRLGIALLEDKEKSLESCKAALKLVQAAFDNENTFTKSDDIDKLITVTGTFLNDCEQDLLDTVKSGYILPILTSFLTNFDNTDSTAADGNFELAKNTIADVLDFITGESYKIATTVEYAFVAFISKSAWKITNVVHQANVQIYQWFINYIKNSGDDPVWVLKDMCEGVFSNLLNDAVTDVNNLKDSIIKKLETWCAKIIEKYKAFGIRGDEVATAYCQFLSGEFSMGKDILFASTSDFEEINSNYEKELSAIIDQCPDQCFAKRMTEYASFFSKYIYATQKFKTAPKLLEFINGYKDALAKHLEEAGKANNAYLIIGCSNMFEFAIETILNHSSSENLLSEILTLMRSHLESRVLPLATTNDFLSSELISFTNGLFKSINEIPNDCFNSKSLTEIQQLITDCFSDLDAILNKDGELVSGTRLSEFVLGNFFTSTISSVGRNAKFIDSPGWFRQWLGKYMTDVYPSFIEEQQFDFAAQISRIYDVAVKVMRFGEYQNSSQLLSIVDTAQEILFASFNPSRTYEFDIYVNAVLSLDHDYNSTLPFIMQDVKIELTNNAAIQGNEVRLEALVNMSSVFAEEKYVVSVNTNIAGAFEGFYNANLNALKDATAGNCAANATLITSWYKNVYDIQDEQILEFIQNRYESELKYLQKL